MNIPSYTQDKQTDGTDKAVEKGIKFMIDFKAYPKSSDGFWGYTGIEVYTMAQCGVKKETLNEQIKKVLDSYSKQKGGDVGTPMPPFTLMALLKANPEKYSSEIETLAKKIIATQKKGLFPYHLPICNPYPFNLYPYIALYLLSEYDDKLVPKEVWISGEKTFRSSQAGDGSWSYKGMGTLIYHTHTCAGAIIVCLCKLAQDKKLKPKDLANDPTVSKALKWLDSNFSFDPKMPGIYKDIFYFLHAAGMLAYLTEHDKFGKHDWYQEGAKHIMSLQKDDGSWLYQKSGHSDILLDTSLAIMFLKKHFFAQWPESNKKE